MNQLLYYIKRLTATLAFNRVLPKSLRKPFITLFNVLGLYFFYLFMLNLTQSVYLIQLNHFMMSIILKHTLIMIIGCVSFMILMTYSTKYQRYLRLGILLGYIAVLCLGVMGYKS